MIAGFEAALGDEAARAALLEATGVKNICHLAKVYLNLKANTVQERNDAMVEWLKKKEVRARRINIVHGLCNMFQQQAAQ